MSRIIYKYYRNKKDHGWVIPVPQNSLTDVMSSRPYMEHWSWEEMKIVEKPQPKKHKLELALYVFKNRPFARPFVIRKESWSSGSYASVQRKLVSKWVEVEFEETVS